MKSPADMILAEIGTVEQIVRMACGVEAARRGSAVSPHDPAVQTLVADLILGGLGAEMRSALEKAEGMSPESPTEGPRRERRNRCSL